MLSSKGQAVKSWPLWVPLAPRPACFWSLCSLTSRLCTFIPCAWRLDSSSESHSLHLRTFEHAGPASLSPVDTYSPFRWQLRVTSSGGLSWAVRLSHVLLWLKCHVSQVWQPSLHCRQAGLVWPLSVHRVKGRAVNRQRWVPLPPRESLRFTWHRSLGRSLVGRSRGASCLSTRVCSASWIVDT